MTVKKQYNVGDTVWIYGINRGNLKPAKGTVIKIVDLRDSGYIVGDHYIIEIPTSVDPLLEIRTWHSISQDENGPVGALRGIKDLVASIKVSSRLGFGFDDTVNVDNELDADSEVSADAIHAALEKSIDSTNHQPLVLKEVKAKPRRRFSRKKTKE